MTLAQQLQSAVDAWVASGGDEQKEAAVHAILDTDDYRAMSYLDRNRPFVTSSKLKELAACAYHAYLRYVKEEPLPCEPEDYFLIGQAVDDVLTHGPDYFSAKYEKVARRTPEAEKVQLTTAQWNTVARCQKEYARREIFPRQPRKRNVLFLLHGLPCKAEIDHWSAEEHRVYDMKTTSSITTFKPMDYALQMGFYSLGVTIKDGQQPDAALCVIDKGSDFSRSHLWVFSRATLMSFHHQVEDLARQWRDSLESSLWPHVNTDTEEGRRACWGSDYWPVCQFCAQMQPTVL